MYLSIVSLIDIKVSLLLEMVYLEFDIPPE
jgi:hypothetical protein